MTDGTPLLPEESQRIFSHLNSHLTGHLQSMVDDLVSEIAPLASGWSSRADYSAPAQNVDAAVAIRTADLPRQDKSMVRRALVSRLALLLPTIIEQMDLPASVLRLYPDSFRRLADYLQGQSDDPYDPTNDCFLKDIRFVLGSSVPCGAQVVDLISRVSPSSAIHSLLRSADLGALIRYTTAGGYGPWFRIHTEARFLTDFNEPGWDRCYERVSDLLARRGNIRGMVGTSWFYDPKILEISPRLAYLQQRPLERGAFLLKHGTGQIHVDRATQTSKTRRGLYQQGKYIPVCYSLLWPRKELLSSMGQGP